MNNWFVALAFWTLFIPPLLSTETLKGQELDSAELRLRKVWNVIRSVELPNNGVLFPHAILHDMGSQMDVFLTFSPGFLKFKNPKIEALQKPKPWYWNLPGTCVHWLRGLNSGSPPPSQAGYYTQKIDLPFTDSDLTPMSVQHWSYKDPGSFTEIYASDCSAVLRLSFASVEDNFFEKDFEAYIKNTLQYGIHIELPQKHAIYVDWRDEPDNIIDYLIKTQNHNCHFCVTTPKLGQLFLKAAEECRRERALKVKDEETITTETDSDTTVSE